MPRGIYLVGSVPMRDAEEVFTTIAQTLGQRCKRIPDGETQERADWITWLEPAFSQNPAFEKSGQFFRIHSDGGTGRERYKLRHGFVISDIKFDSLFYANIASDSYAMFRKLRSSGKISPSTKFQVDLVPAHSVIWLFLVDELHSAIDPIYNEALKREIDKIAAAIPAEDLAIQFDVASAVFARLEREEPGNYGRTKSEMQETFTKIVADLVNHVPQNIDVLLHLCYGDSNHKHVVEPTDMSDMVEFSNRISTLVQRPIQLIHMPVPRDRSDEAYFKPLGKLKLRSETEVCLGLVHHTDVPPRAFLLDGNPYHFCAGYGSGRPRNGSAWPRL